MPFVPSSVLVTSSKARSARFVASDRPKVWVWLGESEPQGHPKDLVKGGAMPGEMEGL